MPKAVKALPQRSTRGQPGRKSLAASPKRGRPAKMVYINVLVRATTRTALTNLKNKVGAPSQGAVIDRLVASAATSLRLE
jgi:hypothetical protein